MSCVSGTCRFFVDFFGCTDSCMQTILSMIFRVLRNHQRIFGLLWRKEDKVGKLVLLLFRSFFIVVKVITLFLMSLRHNHSEPSGTFLLSLLYWLSKKRAIWHSLMYSMVTLTWSKMTIESVNVCIRGVVTFLIWVIVQSLLVFRSSSVLTILAIAPIALLSKHNFAFFVSYHCLMISLQFSLLNFPILRLAKLSRLACSSKVKVMVITLIVNNFFSDWLDKFPSI